MCVWVCQFGAMRSSCKHIKQEVSAFFQIIILKHTGTYI
jgi:hypothetical protein